MSDGLVWASVAILCAAGFAHGLFGIGFAMVATPLLALFLDYRAAVWLSALPLLLMATSWLVVNRRHLQVGQLPASLLVAIGLGAGLGTALQMRLPERASLLLLAALLGASVLISLLLERWQPARAASPQRAAAVFGTLAGVTESALNVGAPFMVLYGAVARLGRLQQLIALNVCFALGKAIQVSLMALAGPPQVSPAALGIGTSACLLAYYLGDAASSRFSDALFRRLLRYFLVVIVAALAVRAALL